MYLTGSTEDEIGGTVGALRTGFMHFLNEENDIKKFKAPLSQLSKLSISLVSPAGTILCTDFVNTVSGSGCDNDPDTYTPYQYVQYIFEVSTIENYIPHVNSYPFNT